MINELNILKEELRKENNLIHESSLRLKRQMVSFNKSIVEKNKKYDSNLNKIIQINELIDFLENKDV